MADNTRLGGTDLVIEAEEGPITDITSDPGDAVAPDNSYSIEASQGGTVTVHITASKYFENPNSVVADGADNELTWAECSVRDLLQVNGWEVSDTRTVDRDPDVIRFEDRAAEANAAASIADAEVAMFMDDEE